MENRAQSGSFRLLPGFPRDEGLNLEPCRTPGCLTHHCYMVLVFDF